MCFNAAKSWKLGWYDDRALEITDEMLQGDGFNGKLAAFVDYDKVPEGEYVLLKVGTKYLIFNEQKGINSETQEFANTVSITDAPTLNDSSDAVAALGQGGQTYEFSNTNGDDVTIKICSIETQNGIDFATVSIYLSNQDSTCGSSVMESIKSVGFGLEETLTTDSFECVLIEVASEYEDNTIDYEHACIAKGADGEFDMRYHIDDNNGKIETKFGDQGIDVLHHSNRYKVTMTNVLLALTPVVSTTPTTEITITDMAEEFSNKRRRMKMVGDRTMVILRVTSSDGTVSKTADQIANAFFGTGGDQNNLKSRYTDCSMGKLNFKPGTGHDFRNGVAEIKVNAPVTGVDIIAFQAKITNALVAKYGSSLRNTYNHVVYAVPRGTNMGAGGSNRWIAFAYMNSYLSVYNNENIVYISNQVHETGHNLGLMHSNHGAQKYGDQSGTMGFGYGK
jgi:hypothetical protein